MWYMIYQKDCFSCRQWYSGYSQEIIAAVRLIPAGIAPVWQTGPAGMVFTNKVSLSQSALISFSNKNSRSPPLLSITVVCCGWRKLLLQFPCFCGAASFINPSISTRFVVASCTMAGTRLSAYLVKSIFIFSAYYYLVYVRFLFRISAMILSCLSTIRLQRSTVRLYCLFFSHRKNWVWQQWPAICIQNAPVPSGMHCAFQMAVSWFNRYPDFPVMGICWPAVPHPHWLFRSSALKCSMVPAPCK